ncbi:hypothetical protein [uncultured Jatrophihabitans sp.]|uniref:hypothetical protein n=1 Tax=uncultured Jatrophihabitans sp. TaxID=1610747 RepID=UPI0035CACE3E
MKRARRLVVAVLSTAGLASWMQRSAEIRRRAEVQAALTDAARPSFRDNGDNGWTPTREAHR